MIAQPQSFILSTCLLEYSNEVSPVWRSEILGDFMQVQFLQARCDYIFDRFGHSAQNEDQDQPSMRWETILTQSCHSYFVRIYILFYLALI
jgi:hypothetical protein